MTAAGEMLRRPFFFGKKAVILASVPVSPKGNFYQKRFMRQQIQAIFKARNTANLFFILTGLLLVSACVFTSGREIENKAPQTPAPTPAASTPEVASEKKTDFKENEKKADAGDFIVQRLEIKNSRYLELDEKVRKEKLLEKAADDLNKALNLPEDIFLQVKDCGEPNAEFDPNTQTITVCYELMEHFSELYRSEGMKPEEADRKMFDAVRFAFLHEIGHGLIYNYKLPIMGNEEDAADRCSSYINIEEIGGDNGVKSVLAAADAFRIESRRQTPSNRNLADEHLLQEQRFYNSLCMIYGSDADKYEYLVSDGYLPRERAVRCPQEFKRTVESWVNLLEPWRKDR
jgi:hypothetical protein